MVDRMARASLEASNEISLSGVSDFGDPMSLSSSAESFTVDKLYLKPAGTACTTGSECMSRVCTSNFCSNVTPPDPLAWMTVVTANQPYGTDFLGLGGLSTKRVGGGIVGRGPKSGYLILGGFVLSACCYNSELDFTFSDIGVPTLIQDFTLDILSKESTTLYFAPLRYDLVSASQKVTSGSVVYYNTNLYAPGYSRHDGGLTNIAIQGGDGGHVILRSLITNNTVPGMDFGDGIYVRGTRRVKFSPTGQVEFNVHGGVQFGAYMGPSGEFYDISRAANLLTLSKQDGHANPLWSHSFPAPLAVGKPSTSSMAFDESGNLYLAFNFAGTANLGNGPMVAQGIQDVGLAKFNSDGVVVWSDHYGLADFDLNSVLLEPTGVDDFVIEANFLGTVDFGQGVRSGPALLAKFDASGALVWDTQAPVGEHKVRGAPTGEVYVASTNANCDFGWGSALTNRDGVVVAQYAACANPLDCQPNGADCTSDAQCRLGHCVDGVCCDKACSGTCEACTVQKKSQGSTGTCGPILANTDPDDECTNASCGGASHCAFPLGTACVDPLDCASGFCVDGVCCDGACSGACRACTAAKKGAGSDGQCAVVALGMNPDGECGTGYCNLLAVCSLAMEGIACSKNKQCASGFCVDGVCCSAACSGLCEACSAAKKGSGSDGQCGLVQASTDPDTECAGGTCNAQGTCSVIPDGTACLNNGDCQSGFCSDGVCCNEACGGTCRACTAAKKGSGVDGVCENIASETDPDNECINEGVCRAGTCAGLSNGYIWSRWRMPNDPSSGLPNPAHYTVNAAADIVVDDVTGLMWQRTISLSYFRWGDAQIYCRDLVYGGFDDWRLPSRVELVSITDHSVLYPAPAIDSAAFPNTPPEAFWTKSYLDIAYIWAVSFSAGEVLQFDHMLDSQLRVRCVR